ncbi:amidase [Roseobacter litoralis]|uniref:Amidase n=1 Tax=Roseobacter litoralis (strain ATCC 49566 / DSM 6996 / JCM 21268 / NBRC 15278 / OCh 149) TaxID=391595 RepID=F7ZG80_ROSLO|nr:amidase [Roseobacter litoralis]AEI94811.1 amidase [Roseobacter litoralis Och 149]
MTAALSNLETLTIASIADGLASGAFTAEEVTLACLEQVKACNAHYNAIIFMNDAALDTARDVDRRRAAGEAMGAMAGVPIVVKDPMDMMGFPTTAGWKLLYSGTGGVDLMPGTDSPVVARMRAADAVIIGKTNVPVLSHTGSHANDSWAGPTLNVVIEDRVPGGSSAGTAAAVASNMCVAGLAEETGGSIQNPASAHGLVGIKPTIGLVPNAGVVPLSANRDVVGPIARNVTDAAICLDVLAGYSAEDPKTLASVGQIPPEGYAAGLSKDGLAGKRIGLYGSGWRNQPLCEETTALYERAKSELAEAGAVLIEDPFEGTDFASLRKPTAPTPNFDGRGLESIAYDVGQYLHRLGPNAALKTFAEFADATAAENPFGPGGVLEFMNSLPDFRAAMENPTQPPELPAFIALKAAYLDIFNRVFDEHELDSLVFPQMRKELPGLHSGDTIQETTVGELNIAGLPAVTLPAGFYATGAPFELIFLGKLWSEKSLIKQAFAYEVH